MLVYGTCNPEGYGDASYEGLYLTDADIREIFPKMTGVPVKIEHRGGDVGKVVTAWMHEGRMDVLMEIDDRRDIEGALVKEFIQRGICPELSLGYHVTMSKSPAGFLRATNKRVVELSIVRQGARDGCKIRGFCSGADASRKKQAEPAATAQPAASASQDSSKRQLPIHPFHTSGSKRPAPFDVSPSDIESYAGVNMKRHKLLV